MTPVEAPKHIQWSDHTARLSASVVKEVTCEKCREQYVYTVQRTETGMGTSVYGLDEQGAQDRAVVRAAQNLQSALDEAFELVPCPCCGAYQAQMVESIKRTHLKWMVVLGAALILGSILLLLGSWFSGSGAGAVTAGGTFIVGIGLVAYRRWSAELLDPNGSDPEPRKQFAATIAVLKKDLPAPAPGDISNRPGKSRQRGG